MTEPNDGREFTRFSSKIQLGDGVDNRGDVQVEVVRDRPGRQNREEKIIELPTGETVSTTVDDSAFAEFYFEMQRAEDVLRRVLDLDDQP